MQSQLIAYGQDTLVTQLQEKPAEGGDLDGRVITAYLNQCTAEAQVGYWYIIQVFKCFGGYMPLLLLYLVVLLFYRQYKTG
jgi:hypothetical protein